MLEKIIYQFPILNFKEGITLLSFIASLIFLAISMKSENSFIRKRMFFSFLVFFLTSMLTINFDDVIKLVNNISIFPYIELISKSPKNIIILATFSFSILSSLLLFGVVPFKTLTTQEETLKITAIFLIFSICLFAENSWCYFASIFIIATTITSVDFLKTLAAIIRNSDAFFKFETIKQSPESVRKKVEEELRIDFINANEMQYLKINSESAKPTTSKVDEVTKSLPSTISPETEKLKKATSNTSEKAIEEIIFTKENGTTFRDAVKLAMYYEDKYFNFLREQTDHKVERNIKLKVKNRSFEVDGLERFDDYIEIYEVKFLSSPNMHSVFNRLRLIDHFKLKVFEIENAINKEVRGHLILIGDFSPENIPKLDSLNREDKKIQVSFLNKNEFN